MHSMARRPLAGAAVMLAAMAAVAAATIRPVSGLVPAAEAAAASVDTGYQRAVARLDETDTYRLALFRMKAHLSVARALLKLRAPGAGYHLREPVRRVFAGIEGQLQARDAPFTRDILAQLERTTEAAAPAALATVDSATAAIDGSFAQTGPLRASSALALSEALLQRAVQLYAGAVSNNEVVDLRGYQTGRGLVLQAEALVRHSSGLSRQPGHEALLAAVVLIRQAWPGVRPPPIVFDPRSVAGRLDEAVSAARRLQ